jgi:hypothetical protein
VPLQKASPVKIPITILATVAAITGFAAAWPATGSVAIAATPPPPPPQVNATATPAPVNPDSSASPDASATPIENPLMPTKTPLPKNPKATPSPPADNRVGLEGVWEVQIQADANTVYTHFNLRQNASTLTGVYLDQHNKKYPIAGSIDGSAVRLVVSMPDGSTILFQGKVDGTTDMLGMLTNAKQQVPFTAEYRPKEKWTDNINAVPGGLGTGTQGGGYTPP